MNGSSSFIQVVAHFILFFKAVHFKQFKTKIDVIIWSKIVIKQSIVCLKFVILTLILFFYQATTHQYNSQTGIWHWKEQYTECNWWTSNVKRLRETIVLCQEYNLVGKEQT